MAEEKLKILYLMQTLLEETDEAHVLNAGELCRKMEERYQYSCNRKTIYADIARLQSYGLNIVQVKGRNHGYYVAERDFSLAELKLLVDAVQSSKFITKRKSEALIRKLEKQTSRENAKQLHRQVFIYNRAKTENDAIYRNVDVIHAALRDNRQIRFRYCEWTVRKELVQKKNGADYIVSPWALTWDNANYYLVAYDGAADGIRHYRVDKMQEIEALTEAREGRERFEGFDLAAFAKKMFGMYGGTDTDVTLECCNTLAGVIIDRFGQEILMFPHDGDHFRVNVTVAVSPQFFGWLAGIGREIRIVRPERVREQYRRYLQEIVEKL